MTTIIKFFSFRDLHFKLIYTQSTIIEHYDKAQVRTLQNVKKFKHKIKIFNIYKISQDRFGGKLPIVIKKKKK